MSRRPSAIRGCAAIVSALPLADPSHAVVRYVGQPVVAIAATSMAAAEEALSLIRVDYKALPFVVDMDEARRPESPKVYDAASAPGSVGRRALSRRRASRSTATFAGPRWRVAAMSRRASLERMSSWRANIAPRCRPTAAWSRTASSPTGARTD